MRPMDVWGPGTSVGVTALLSGSLPALGIAAAAWILVKLAPRMNGATRHTIWWLVLALAIVVPLGFAVHDIGGMRAARLARGVVPAFGAVGESWGRGGGQTARTDWQAEAPAPQVVQLRGGQWGGWVAILWAAIFLAQLGRLGWSYRRLRGIKARSRAAGSELSARFQAWMAACGIRRPVRLLISEEVATPMAAGFRHPAVLVPGRMVGEFGRTELDHVLLHELAHLARRDDWSNLVARVAHAAWWWNPAAAWALKRIEREREIACDEWVVAATGDARPYATSLARLFEFCVARRKESLAAGMAGHASQLGERIELLIRRKGATGRGVSVWRVGGCTLALLVLAGMAARTPRWVVLAQETERSSVRSSSQPVSSSDVRTADPHSFLAAVVAAGYGDLSVEEIIQLSNNGVSAKYLMGISRSGWGKLKPREIVELHNNSVSTDFLRATGEAGIPGLTVQGVISLNSNGVTSAFIQGMQAAGLAHLDVHEIIEALQNGLSAKDVREAKEFGSNLTLKQVIRLKQAGVLRNE